MASRPRPSEAAGRVAAGLGAHRVALASRPLLGVGSVGRAAMRFGALTFLSRSARRRELARDAGSGQMLVRPPDYWAGSVREDEAADGSTIVPRSGDAAFDALLAKRRAAEARRSPARRFEPRGLPATVHRRGVSVAGPLTGPGSVVRRLTPVAVAPPPNPATTGGTITTTVTPVPPRGARRGRGSAPGQRTSSPAVQRSPGRAAHRPPSGSPPDSPARGAAAPSPSPSPSAPAGLQRLERLAAVATSTADALRTPAFDALLDSMSSVSSVVTAGSGREFPVQGREFPPRTEDGPGAAAEPTIDASVVARWSGSAAVDRSHRPSVAMRTARALPVAAVSVHAAGSVHAAQRRLSFTSTCALAGRSPWDDVRRQPVGGVLAPAAAAAAASASVAAVPDTRPGTRELRRAPGAAAHWFAPGETSTSTATTAAAGTVVRASSPSATPIAHNGSEPPPHGLVLPRVLRRAARRDRIAPVASAASRAGIAPGESLADAMRRVFGEPGRADAQPGAAAAVAMRSPLAPPRGTPTSSPLDTASAPASVAARRADGRRPEPAAATTTNVIPLRRTPVEATPSTSPMAAHARPLDAPTVTRAPAPTAFDTTSPTYPGALFAAPVLEDGAPLVRRSVARPGTVLARATTHRPLAHTDLARIDARVGGDVVARPDVTRLPMAAPAAVVPARDADPAAPVRRDTEPAASPVRRETAPAASLRRETAPRRAESTSSRPARRDRAAEAVLAHDVALAVHRESARVAVRRLPLGAAGAPLPTRRARPAPEFMSADTPSAAPGTPTTLAQRVASLAGTTASPFELVRRVPVAHAGPIIVRTPVPTRSGWDFPVQGGEFPPRTRARRAEPPTAETPTPSPAPTSAPLVRRIPVAAPVVRLRRAVTLPGELTGPGAAATPAAAGTAPQTLAQRVAALAAADAGTGPDLVRRLPVGAPAAAVVTAASASPTSGTGTSPSATVAARHTQPSVMAARAAAAPLALPSPTRARATASAQVAAATPLVRRAVHLPNASTPADAARHAPPAVEIGNPLAQRLAALTAVRGAPGTAGLPVAAPATTVVRRSMAIPTAPTPHAPAASVLPGIRATAHPTTSAPARRTTSPAAATTADRLRDLVASGAFDGGTPVRRLPVAPAAATVVRTAPVSSPTTAVQRFEDVIRRAPATRLDKPQPLPNRFRPLAERLLGPRVAVKVVHGAVTRAALEAAGHEAATTNATIHLPTRPDASARTMSIVAHELEHVAAPSPVPRFHGGADSPEERRAARTESVVRRLAAQINRRGGPESSAGTAGLPVAALPAFGHTGATAAEAATSPSGAPAAAVQRTPASAASASTVRRSGTGAVDGDDDPVRRTPRGRSASSAASTAAAASESSVSGGSAALSQAQLSAIIRAVEDRLLEEIERRGGLRRGGF